MTDDTTSIDSKATEKPADHQPPASAETSATWTATDGSTLDYTASASWMVLREKEKPSAEVFSVSYVADDGEDRPVTFVFNGGPGAGCIAQGVMLLNGASALSSPLTSMRSSTGGMESW